MGDKCDSTGWRMMGVTGQLGVVVQGQDGQGHTRFYKIPVWCISP